MEHWRLIIDLSASGAFNMAADQYLLQTQSQSKLKVSPTFRIYTWDQFTLTLGKNQALDDGIDQNWCIQHGVELIRRTTGGKAVMHGADMTYSFCASRLDTRFAAGVEKNYETLSKCFVNFFSRLGLGHELHTATNKAAETSHVCFVQPSSYEILVGGKKIIGSAQRQTSQAFLQHGTIPLNDQRSMLTAIFPTMASGHIDRLVTSLEEQGVFPQKSLESLIEILIAAMAEVFQIQFILNPWTETERQSIRALETEFPALTLESVVKNNLSG